MPKEETVISLLREIRDHLKGQKAVVSRFIDNGDGTVSDPETGLMWVKNPHTDLPKAFKDGMPWKDAIEACKNLDFASHKDWRLPTIQELFSIIDYTKAAGEDPAIDTAVFPDTKRNWYWSITPTSWSSAFAWYVHFSSGDVSNHVKDYRGYVRPVRSQ